MYDREKSFSVGSNQIGWKIAKVVSNEDPKAQERILIRIMGYHNMNNEDTDNAIWAHHCAPTRSASGDLPEPGDWVYVHFVNMADNMAVLWFGFVRSSFQDVNDGGPANTIVVHDLFGNRI